MRIVITTLHVHPVVPLARALEAAGHEVVVCADDNRPALAAIGLRFAPAGTSMAAVLPQVLPQLGALPPCPARGLGAGSCLRGSPARAPRT